MVLRVLEFQIFLKFLNIISRFFLHQRTHDTLEIRFIAHGKFYMIFLYIIAAIYSKIRMEAEMCKVYWINFILSQFFYFLISKSGIKIDHVHLKK